MFESANTYSTWASSYSASSVSSCGANVISTRMSDRSWSSSSTGGSVGSGFTGSGSAFASYSGTGSFLDMHRSNVSYDRAPLADEEIAAYAALGSVRPGGGTTGELDPDPASPVGDVLLPMLLMACVYAVVRFFKNFKIKHSANRTSID